MPTTLALRNSSSPARRPTIRSVARVAPTASGTEQGFKAPATRAVVRVTPRVPAEPAPSLLQDLNRALLALVETVETWSARREQRRALQGLPDQMLQDIGRSRAEAEAEANKPFWMA
jgi:uncharacterized protein YjiS (DUF1127 family)